MVRKWIVNAGYVTVLVATTACASGGRSSSGGGSSNAARASGTLTGGASGAASGMAAVEAFMRAVKAQDLQTMSAMWGTTRGPARDQMERGEMEKRLIIIQCKLDHESWRALQDRPQLLAGGRAEFQLEIRQKGMVATTAFTTTVGPQNRWYVEIVDLEPLREFCR